MSTKQRAAEARELRAERAKLAIFVRLDRDIKLRLDEAALDWGVPRGSIIERALDFYFRLASLENREKIRRPIEDQSLS